jgi:predicted Zn-ribbon and HTH transcriptional regulator
MSEKCKTCNQTTEYQGWRNYQTWAFALWADNEEQIYHMTRAWAREAKREATPPFYRRAECRACDQEWDAPIVYSGSTPNLSGEQTLRCPWCDSRDVNAGPSIGREAPGILADRLKEWAEDSRPDLGATVWDDLLGSALDDVDWQEIAENWLSELEEESGG